MATNKTIAPTGVTVQIPALTDTPDMSVPANAIDKAIDGINALNSKIGNLHGLSEANTGIAATDLNNCDYAGTYMFNSSASNRPSGVNYGVCFTIATSEPQNTGVGWVFQLAFGTSDSTKMFMRSRINNGTWSAWKSITFS